MKNLLTTLFSFCILIIIAHTASAAQDDIQNDPVKVVKAVFNAAKTGDFTKLSGLCSTDPRCSQDGDVKGICNISSQSKQKQEDFKKVFEKSVIVGEPKIHSIFAEIRITYMEHGLRQATFHLVQLSGKWYLDYLA